MSGPFEARPQFQDYFYAHHQTFNIIVTTPSSLAARNLAQYSFITHRHKIYAFTLPLFMGLLQIQSASPFQHHPVATSASVCGTLGYYLAFRAWLCYPLYATQLSLAMTLFGLCSLVSLVTLLLPESWWHIKCISYLVLAMVELQEVVNILYVKYYVGRIQLIIRRLWPQNSSMHLLPLTHVDLI